MCDKCGTRGYLPGQRDANQQSIREYQKALLGYISPSDVLALREKYLLTQEQAGVIFGGGKQGFSKWECGKSAPAGPTARLIKLALKFPSVMLSLTADAGIKLAETTSHSRRITDNNDRYARESSVELTNAKPFASVVTWTLNPLDYDVPGLAKSRLQQRASIAQQRGIVILDPKQVGVPQARYVDMLREQGGGSALVADKSFIGTAALGEDILPFDFHSLVSGNYAVNPLTGALFPTSTISTTSTSGVVHGD